MDKDRIAGSAKEFSGKVEGTVGEMAGDTKTQAAGQAREAMGTVQNLYGQAKDAASEATEAATAYAKQATGYAKQAYDSSGDTVRDGSQALANMVQENPIGSVLIAGAIGFALAMLFTRAPRRPPSRWQD